MKRLAFGDSIDAAQIFIHTHTHTHTHEHRGSRSISIIRKAVVDTWRVWWRRNHTHGSAHKKQSSNMQSKFFLYVFYRRYILWATVFHKNERPSISLRKVSERRSSSSNLPLHTKNSLFQRVQSILGQFSSSSIKFHSFHLQSSLEDTRTISNLIFSNDETIFAKSSAHIYKKITFQEVQSISRVI